MKDWKTTLSGVLAAVGGYLTESQTGWLHIVGQVVTAIGLLLLGYHATDKAAK